MANFITEDVEYLRHGDRRLIARLYKPKGAGPFPAVVDLHGGAWNNGDLDGRRASTRTWRRTAWSLPRSNSATPPMAIPPRSSTSITPSAGSRRTPRS